MQWIHNGIMGYSACVNEDGTWTIRRGAQYDHAEKVMMTGTIEMLMKQLGGDYPVGFGRLDTRQAFYGIVSHYLPAIKKAKMETRFDYGHDY